MGEGYVSWCLCLLAVQKILESAKDLEDGRAKVSSLLAIVQDHELRKAKVDLAAFELF